MILKNRFLFIALPVMLIGACMNLTQPSPKVAFYTLEYEAGDIGETKPLPFAIRIERFSVAPVYNTPRIIYRDKSFIRTEYTYHKWRANPGDLVTYFLARDMKRSGLFKAVIPRDSGIPATYLLEGAVDEFLEWDSENTWKAVLGLSITLMAENEPDVSKRILFQRTYRATQTCRLEHPKALAEAMSLAMAEISARIIKDIYGQLKEREL